MDSGRSGERERRCDRMHAGFPPMLGGGDGHDPYRKAAQPRLLPALWRIAVGRAVALQQRRDAPVFGYQVPAARFVIRFHLNVDVLGRLASESRRVGIGGLL